MLTGKVGGSLLVSIISASRLVVEGVYGVLEETSCSSRNSMHSTGPISFDIMYYAVTGQVRPWGQCQSDIRSVILAKFEPAQ